jgi:hypothetical protein
MPSALSPCGNARARPADCDGQTCSVPLIDVTYDESLSEDALRRLGRALPEIVAEAVGCPEEPSIGPPGLGDIEIRFRAKGSLDVGNLNVVVEVRTKLYQSRAEDKQQRADRVRERLADLPLGGVGVWLIMSEGAWSQG